MLRLTATHLVHIGCSTDPGDLGVPLVPSLSLWWDGGAYTHPGLLPGLGRMVQGAQ